jgi:hypothetical protein
MQHLQRQKQQQLQLQQVQQLQREELEKRQRESARGTKGKQSSASGAGAASGSAQAAVATDVQPNAPVIVRVPRKVKSAAGVPYTPLALCRAAPPPGKFCTLARIVSYWPRDVDK